jgi:hypothetical protein
MRRTVFPSMFILSVIALSCADEVKEPEPALSVTASGLIDEACGPCTWTDEQGVCHYDTYTVCHGKDVNGHEYHICCPNVCSETNNPDGSITPSCGGGGGSPPPPPPCPQGPCDQPQCRDPYPVTCGLGCCGLNETCVGGGAGCCPADQPACGNGCCPPNSICTNGTCAF